MITSVGVRAPGITTTSCALPRTQSRRYGIRRRSRTALRPQGMAWALCGLRHSARPHHHARMALHQVRDNLESLGHGQGDFDDGNPSFGDGLGGKEGVLLPRHANRGDNSRFPRSSPAPRVSSLGRLLWRAPFDLCFGGTNQNLSKPGFPYPIRDSPRILKDSTTGQGRV